MNACKEAERCIACDAIIIISRDVHYYIIFLYRMSDEDLRAFAENILYIFLHELEIPFFEKRGFEVILRLFFRINH